MDLINDNNITNFNKLDKKLNQNNNCDVDQLKVLLNANSVKLAINQDVNESDHTISYHQSKEIISDTIKQLPKSVRETVFEDVDDYFGQLEAYLQRSTNQNESESLLINLQNGFNQILDTSYQYEYKHLPANGFITYCVMIRCWLIKCGEKLNCQLDSVEKKSFLNDIQIVIKGFLLVKEMLLHFHSTQLKHHRSSCTSESGQVNENDDSDDGQLPLFSATMDETIYQLGHCFKSTEFQETLARSFSLFWLSPRSKLILKLYQKGISWTYVNFLKSWRVLANKRYRCKTFIKLANRANMGFPVDVATIIDGHLSRKVCRNLLYRNKDAIGTNFWVNRQGRWFVPTVGPGIVEKSPPVTGRPLIRCRFIRHRCKPIRTEVLIFHCHGSGFILSRPDIHDAYLKPWVARLGGVSVLSVDYSLMAQYPGQFQDVLDAYLWVTSGDKSVMENIGFHPKKIILIGDSAGSMLSMSIPLLLHEIAKHSMSSVHNDKNTIYPSLDQLTSTVNSNVNNNNTTTTNQIKSTTPINMPVAFISFYGTFQLTGAWSSSRIMTIFDPILHYGNVLAIAGCLGGIQGPIDGPKDIPKGRFAKVSSYIAEDIRLVKRTLRPRKISPWYMNNNGQLATDQFQELFKRLQSPYLNCPTFDSFEAFKDMSLCLITSFGCTFLDDNIELARSWKGPCEVHVLEGQIHGFLFMRHEKAAIKFSDEKVIQFVNKFLKTESTV